MRQLRLASAGRKKAEVIATPRPQIQTAEFAARLSPKFYRATRISVRRGGIVKPGTIQRLVNTPTMSNEVRETLAIVLEGLYPSVRF